MIRRLISKFNKSLAARMVAARRRHEAPIKVWIEPEKAMNKPKYATGTLSISGETQDLSDSGIGFIVSSIRIKENYLVGENRTLNVEIDLPQGKVQMQVVGQRYEQVGIHVSSSRYLIGAQIVKMSSDDREIYEYFLAHGDERRKTSLALGIDKT